MGSNTGVRFLEIEVTVLGMYAIIHRHKEYDVSILQEGGTIRSKNVPDVEITYGENSFGLTAKLLVECIHQSVIANSNVNVQGCGGLISCSPFLSLLPEKDMEDCLLPGEIVLPCPKMRRTEHVQFTSGELESIKDGENEIMIGYHILTSTNKIRWSVIPCNVVADGSKGTLRFKLLNICKSITVIALQTTILTNLPVIARHLKNQVNTFYINIILGQQKGNDRQAILRVVFVNELDELLRQLTTVSCYNIIFQSEDIAIREGQHIKVCLDGNVKEVKSRKDNIMLRFHQNQTIEYTFLMKPINQEMNWGSEKHRGNISFYVANIDNGRNETSSNHLKFIEVGRVHVDITKEAPISKIDGVLYFSAEGPLSEAVMKGLSERISLHWSKLAQRLEVATSTIQKLQKDYKTVTRRCYVMLGKWHQGQNSQSDSMKTLSEALDDIGRKDLVQWLQDTQQHIESEQQTGTMPELDKNIAECSPS
ncbi:ankyrin-1-like [Antedon mediterranea]|uniref:ankyrin-1-like n=1 Tax=Antedon mediterranea TaxID=105859 RepID=UPI003AF93904